jgi:CheY-like chemotaxis protein
VLNLTNLDLNEVVNDLMKMLPRVIGEHILLEHNPGSDLATVRADRGQIEQILMNLCLNSRDAMLDGGKLTLESQNVLLDQNFCRDHSWAKPGHYVVLTVTDTGCGMDEDTLSRIFEPFFTTKEVGKGTGLGLSTVYGLIQQHEGMLHVYSEVGSGTIFKIYLPVVDQPRSAALASARSPSPGGSETILVAEDAEPVRNLARHMLERNGYQVLTAENGLEAVRLFKEHREEIDLLLLDVVMPGLGGRGVFEAVRRLDPHVGILFASGYSDDSIHTGFVLDEGLQLIQKPYDPDLLLRKIRETIDARSRAAG